MNSSKKIIFLSVLSLVGILFLFYRPSFAQERSARDRALFKGFREKHDFRKKMLGLSDDIDMTVDVPYLENGDTLQKLDIYAPVKTEESPATKDQKELYPVLFHVHGGGWQSGDKKHMKKTGIFYASKDILFITPNYRLSPKVTHPAHVEDCAAALAWVREHVSEFGGDRSRIFLSGHSAGAHLVSLLGTDQKYLKKYGIDPTQLAGIISVDTASFDLANNENERMVGKFIQQAFGSEQKALMEASPYYNINARTNYPKFFILNTTDRKNAIKGAEQFVNKLRSVRGDVEFMPIDNHSHKDMAEGMYDPLSPVSSAILRFVR